MAKKDTQGTFTIINDEGKEIECEILFTFDSDETNKSYIVYTDNTLDDNGDTKVFASVYDPTGKNASLQSIETDREWKMIEAILETLQEEISGEEEIEEDIESWIVTADKLIDTIGEEDDVILEPLISQIKSNLLDENYMDYSKLLFDMLKKAQKKSKSGYQSNINLGMEAYQQKNYELAELIFIDADAKNNLAYLIRRGEVKDSSKYSVKDVAELLKEGVHNKEPFSMVNMSLLWALRIGGDEAWNLADNIMSNIPNDNLALVNDWWLKVGKAGDNEGYLVHYWLLKYGKIKHSSLGKESDIRSRLQLFIKDMPIFI